MSTASIGSGSGQLKRQQEAWTTVVEKKRKALEVGMYTDFAFLVGPDDNTAELVHASKLDLISSSEFFEALLRSPLTVEGPVRMKQVNPRFFKMLLHFVHVHYICPEMIVNLDDSVELARAADEFLVYDLGALCSNLVEKFLSVDTVWKVLDKNLNIKPVTDGCKKILTEQTLLCLEQESFLEINEATLIWFLKLEKMNIQSEMELVLACLKYSLIKHNTIIAMRSFIPYLRLLTLKKHDDLLIMSEALSSAEAIYFSYRMLPSTDKKELTPILPPTICPITEDRCIKQTKMETLVLIPDSKILSSRDLIERKLFTKLVETRDTGPTSHLTLTAKKYITIKQIEVLCKIQVDPTYVAQPFERVVFGSQEEYNCDISVDATVQTSTSSRAYVPVLSGVCKTNASACFIFEEPIFVPKGETVQISVWLSTEECYHRKIQVENITNGLHEWNNPNVKNVFEKFKLDSTQVEEEDEDDDLASDDFFFIKSLVYSVIEDCD